VLQVPVDALPSYMAQMLAPDSPPDAVASAQHAFVQMAATFERNVPANEVQVSCGHRDRESADEAETVVLSWLFLHSAAILVGCNLRAQCAHTVKVQMSCLYYYII
jgi:hypothetical protein